VNDQRRGALADTNVVDFAAVCGLRKSRHKGFDTFRQSQSFAVPVAGWLADRFGGRRVLATAAVGTAALAFPFFSLLDTGRPAAIWAALMVCKGQEPGAALDTDNALRA
jgi:hypothetical protein